MAKAKDSGSKPIPERVSASAPGGVVLKSRPFRLTQNQGVELISHMRFPNDVGKRRELLSAKSLTLSGGELLALARADRLLTNLDLLERMEKHYRDVSRLGAQEVRRRLEAADPDDLGALAYKSCLTEKGTDPRLPMAQRILSLIPIARRNLEVGKPALELNEIFGLNDQANMLLIAPHLRRGLKVLAATRAGGRRRNPAGRGERESLAFEFRAAKKVRPRLTQREFCQSRDPFVSVKTLQRGLQDLKNSPI